MQERTQNNSSNGFLLGLIAGVLLTLLFVTKKGRRILRMLTEEGIDRIEDLERVFQEKMVDREDDFTEEEIVGNDFVSHEPLPIPVVATVSPIHRQYETEPTQHHETKQNHTENHVHEQHEVHHPQMHHGQQTNHHMHNEHTLGGQQSSHRVKSSPRRFFKGVPKKN